MMYFMSLSKLSSTCLPLAAVVAALPFSGVKVKVEAAGVDTSERFNDVMMQQYGRNHALDEE